MGLKESVTPCGEGESCGDKIFKVTTEFGLLFLASAGMRRLIGLCLFSLEFIDFRKSQDDAQYLHQQDRAGSLLEPPSGR